MKTLPILIAVGLTASFTLSAYATTPASSLESGASHGSIKRLVSAVRDATPDSIKQDTIIPSKSTAGYTTNARVKVNIPHDGTKPITVTKPGANRLTQVKLFIDSRAKSQSTLAEDGSVVYAGNSVAEIVQPTSEGVRVNTVIRSKLDPQQFSHKLQLSPGLRLISSKQLEDLTPEEYKTHISNAVYIVNSNNELVGGVSTPWAFDATGKPVPTYYTIRDNTLVQHVNHHVSGIVYPVVADPWLGFALISSARWTHRSPGWTLMVSPTSWARANAPHYFVGVAGWNELYAKYRHRGLNTNLGGMRDQYICHQQYAFWKSTWNLDEWRPDVSYAQTVNSKCNPGGGKFID